MPRTERAGLFTRRVGDALWNLQPLVPVPNGLLRRRLATILDAYIRWTTRRALRTLAMDDPVLWSYTPLAEQLRGRLGERLVCYDVVDDYPSQPNYRALGERLVEDDAALTRAADVVLTTSERLLAERTPLNPNTHLLGNAADVDLFARARSLRQPAPQAISGLRHPIIGFHGAVTSYKIDTVVVRELAERRPDWQFVFVGPVQDAHFADGVATCANVHLVGPRDPKELPPFLAAFDVCFVPYRRTSYTERVSALKLRECLAAGRPVVASALPGFEEVSDLIALAEDVDGFEAQIEGALTSPPAQLSLEHPALADFSWERKADKALTAVLNTMAAA